ncbi:MAG: hypothetical protein ACLQVX_04395 [Limisphaerales bacterium]
MKRTRDEENLHRQTQATWEAPFPEGRPGDEPSPRPPARLSQSGLDRARRSAARWAALSALFLAAWPSYPQASFPFPLGANGQMLTLAQQPDGSIVVGGGFTSLGGQSHEGIGRLKADGTVDAAFNAQAEGGVDCLAVQADQKILVGGPFTNLNGQALSYLGRLNVDGSLDSDFSPNVGGAVTCLAVRTDGSILVQCNFAPPGGNSEAVFDALDKDGSLDSRLSEASSTGLEILMQCFLSEAGGAVLSIQNAGEGDDFYEWNNFVATQSLAYDGSTITWLRGGDGPEVWAATFEGSTNGADWIALGAGTRIAGGWQLTNVVWPTNASIRVQGFVAGGAMGNGSAWVVEGGFGFPFNTLPPVSLTNNAGAATILVAGVMGSVPLGYQWLKNGVALTNEGVITSPQSLQLTLSNVLGGDAGTYSIILSNALGSITSQVGSLTVVDPVITTQAVCQTAALGETAAFNVAADGTAPMYYQWYFDGAVITGATRAVLELTNLQPSNAGGYALVVTNIYGSVTSSTATLSIETPFNSGANGTVSCIALQPDGKVLVAGGFTLLSHQPCTNLGRLNPDGAIDTSFSPQAGPVNTLSVQPDGRILAGGLFAALAGQPCTNLGRLNPDGTLDISFLPNPNGMITSLALQANGQILVLGSFTQLAGHACTNFGRVQSDGTLDTTFNPGAVGPITTVALQADGKILVGGDITALGGQACAYLGRLNADGSLDASFNPQPNNVVRFVAVQGDGNILVAGIFDRLGGQACPEFGRLNADGTLDTSFTHAAYLGVPNSIAIQADGEILTSPAGPLSPGIGRLNGDGSIDSSLNHSAFIDTQIATFALQPDGSILVGGSFAMLDETPCPGIGRVDNTGPATESLTFDGSTISWLRGGTAPDVWRTTFEASTNGADWVALGAGTYIPGGWQFTNVTLPPNASIRARGFVATPSFGRSWWGAGGWFVENLTGPPALLSQPASLIYRVGTNAALTAVASGSPPLSCQWLFNGAVLPGAIYSLLSLANIQPTNAGQYAVVVSNSLGSVTGDIATVTVVAAPVAPPIALRIAPGPNTGGKSVTLTWNTENMLSYQVQYTTNLSQGTWTVADDLGLLPGSDGGTSDSTGIGQAGSIEILIAAGSTLAVTAPISAAQQQFYRVICLDPF